MSKNKRSLNILDKCMELKKYGVDAFFDYVPHVEMLNISIYENGWEKNADPDIEVGLISLKKSYEGDATIEDVERILENLLKSKEAENED